MTSQPVEPEAEPRPLRAKRGWLLSTSTTLTLGLVSLVTSPLAARFLGPEGRGRLVVLQVLPQLLADISAIGLPFAIVHYGARYPRARRTLLRWSMGPALLGSLVMFGIGQGLASTLTSGVDADTRLFRIYLLLCPIVAFTTLANETFRAAGRFGAWSAIALARGLSWPVAVLIGITRPEPDLGVVVAAHLTLATLTLVVAQVAARRAVAGSDDTPVESRRAYVAYGVHSIASTLPRSANAKVDQLIMTALVSKSDLGLYAAAVGWSFITVPAMRGLSNVTMPIVSAATGEQRLFRVRQMASAGLLAGAALAVVGVFVTALLWEPIYGSDFTRARSAAVVMIPAAILLEYGLVLGNVMRSLGRPLRLAVLELAFVGVSVVGVLAVLPVSTVLGPALVSLAVYAIATLLYLREIATTLRVPVGTLLTLAPMRELLTRRRAPA